MTVIYMHPGSKRVVDAAREAKQRGNQLKERGGKVVELPKRKTDVTPPPAA